MRGTRMTVLNMARLRVHLADNRYRAFADYVFGSMILHFFCVNFIN